MKLAQNLISLKTGKALVPDRVGRCAFLNPSRTARSLMLYWTTAGKNNQSGFTSSCEFLPLNTR